MIGAGPSVLHLADFVNGYPFKPSELEGSTTPVIRIRQLLDPGAHVDHTDVESLGTLIGDGDLILAWSGTLAVRLWDRGPAQLNQHLFRVDVHDHVETLWFRYALELVVDVLRGRMHGSAMTHITREMLREVRLPVPSVEEQRRIAAFLDAETARIDELIDTKTRMIDRCTELRSAITYAVVTGGMTGAHERRPSSVPWAPSLPGSWREGKLTLLATLGTGHTPSRTRPDWWENCTIPWVTTGEVAQLRSDRIEFLETTREAISELGVANSSAVVHPAGTVFLSRTASAGYSGIMGADMATSQDFVTWTCGPLLRPRFLLLCLRAMRRDLLERLAQGSTHKTIYMPDIESIRIPVPPLHEQETIVEAAWDRMAGLVAAEDVLFKQIELLRERRRSLITAAVTGELEVA